jgi:TatD DNase family protein
MIIDSHAHYAHHLYENHFKYISIQDDHYVLNESDRAGMLANLEEHGVQLCIEPSTRLANFDHQIEVVAKHSPYLRLAMGVHPKYCYEAAWEDRQRLWHYVQKNPVIAIGETGLDYSVQPPQLKKIYQKMWFFYQIRIAHQMNLPLILHFRDAYDDGLQLLARHRDMLHGGVAHCFNEDYQTAQKLIDLGFAIGIGSKLLSDSEEGLRLQETVRQIPLESILIETDAPYLRPAITIENCTITQNKKARTTSIILPAVLDKIAELRGENRDFVENVIYQNTLRVFRIEP